MTKETAKTKALYDIETSTDSAGNVHLWAWIVEDRSTGEWVNGKTKETFIKFANRGINEDNNYIHSKAKDLLKEITEK